ncbi:hypothetical protein GC105_05140 [Alkalibaculum sp. M08DMB]|uniref:Cell division protein FtsL n=1 Tax=Alkalibaculum sporogenes TaxID=2655001 RepID=A0A6A7K6Y3_9FIRM|nr:hypothetical protein [Alkalibaculum sporogenes]MPW25174.1 hypothetical protein [Alkalibaculum sporogenes]
MVITEKRRYNYYLEDDDIAITRIRDKYKKTNTKKFKSLSKCGCVLIVLFAFFLGIMLLIQHSRITTINSEIVEVEKQLKEIQMINDSKEGMLLSTLDLDSIEKVAKEKLGMVEPTIDQYSYLAISDSNLRANTNTDIHTANEDKATGSWFTRLID